MRNLCELRSDVIEREFGKLNTCQVVLMDERAEHIRAHHPQDFALFEVYGKRTVEDPDIIIRDTENINTVFMILRLENTNLNAIVRLSIATSDEGFRKNSVMTFFRLRDKNLEKLMSRHKVLYIRDPE